MSKLNKNFVDLVPIVQCAQCPGCRAYVPIPPDQLQSFIPAPNVNPTRTVPVNDITSGLTYRINTPQIQQSNSVTIQPPVSRLN